VRACGQWEARVWREWGWPFNYSNNSTKLEGGAVGLLPLFFFLKKTALVLGWGR